MKDYLRSPREIMLGWVHLPRYIDKIRLYLRGELSADYLPNFGKGLDGMWLKAVGVTHDQMLDQVRESITDGQIAEWLRKRITATPEALAAFNDFVLYSPSPTDRSEVERFEQFKVAADLAGRVDLCTFVDCLDAEEGRL